MWQYDFHLFYQAGQAVLSGLSSYTIFDFYAPYPHAVLFAPVALLPEGLAYWLFVAVTIFMLVLLVGRRSIWALVSFPVLFSLFVGQLDMTSALVVSMIGPWAMPLLLARLQLGFVVGPGLMRAYGWRGIMKALVSGAAMLILTFLIRPAWFTEWLAAIPTISTYSVRDASLYYLFPRDLKGALLPVISIVVLLIALILRSRRMSWGFTSLFIPVSNIYSTAMLAEWFGPLEVILSWLAIFAVGGNIHGGAPMYWVSLSILFRRPLTQMLGWILSLFSTRIPSLRRV